EVQLLEAQRLAHVGNWEFDLNTQDFICSPELLRICGLDDPIPPQTLEAFAASVHPNDWPELAAAIRRTRDDGTPYALTPRIVRPDGAIRQTFCKGQAVCNDQNQVVKLQGVSQDITEITKAELALQASEHKQQTLIRALPDLIMRMSRDGVFLDLFAASNMTVLGAPEAFVGRHIFNSSLPAEVSAQRLKYVDKALSTGELQIYEQTLFNGQRQVVEEVRILPSGADEVLVIVRDITERKAAEEALRLANESLHQQSHRLKQGQDALAQVLIELQAAQEERQIQYRELVFTREAIEIERQRYQNLFNFAPDGYVVTDVEGVIQEANRAIAALIGTKQSQLVNCLLSNFVEESNRLAFNDLLRALKQSSSEIKLETEDLKLFSDQGSTISVAITGTAIFDEQQVCIGHRWRIQDISDRKQAELALRLSKRRYATLTENSPVGIFQTDTNGHCIYHNPRWCEISGLPLEESLGPNWAKAVHPDDRERVTAAWYSTVSQQAAFKIECRFQQPSGQVLWIYAQATPLLDEQGVLLGYIGTVTDITERYQAEAALRESEAKFRQLADNITSIFFIHDAQTGALLYASPAFETIWGVPCEVLIENPHAWLDYVHPDDVDWLIAAVEALNFDVLSNAEYRIIRPDGEARWLASRSFPIMDASGQVYRIAGVVEDISDRKTAEAALQASEERLRTALDAAQMGSWDWNLETNEVIWSDSLERLIGLEPGTFDNRLETAISVVHPEDRQRVIDISTRSIQEGTPCYVEFRVVKANGELRWIASQGNVIQDASGRPLRMAGMDMDITDRKEAELSLQRTNALLAAINTAQTQFITDADPQLFFDHVLKTLLALTDSEYGFIGDILLTADEPNSRLNTQDSADPKTVSLADIAWFAASHHGEDEATLLNRINVRPLQPLVDQVIAAGQPVIANHLATDEWSTNRLGNPDLFKTFLGVPFYRGDQLLGIIGLANRADGYDTSMLVELSPFLNICRSTIEAYRNETKRQRAEQALQHLNEELEQRVQRRTAELARSEADLRTIFNNVYDAIFIHDLDGTILDVNDRALQLHRATHEQLVASNIVELSVHDAAVEQIPELLNRALKGEVLQFEWKTQRYADQVTLETEVSLRSAELGNRSVIIAGVRDISDRKQAETALQESRNMLKLVLDAIPQRVFWKDRDSRFLGCNPAFANDFQLTDKDIVGKTDTELPWADGAERYRAADAEVMSTGLAWVNYEESLVNGYGELTWIRTSRVPLT
ncbi:MAG: PAS domain S-box protein, partial [Cyanobacteria bacterium P01_H01_bin.121]